MINIASIDYNSPTIWPEIGLADAIYHPWSGFEAQPLWSEYPDLYSREAFNCPYDVESSLPENFKVVTGGEPFLQGGIEWFLEDLSESTGSPIRLDTDG